MRLTPTIASARPGGSQPARPTRRELLRWSALALLYLVLLAGPPAVFGENPPLRVANAVAVVFLLAQPPRRWLPLGLLLWVAAGLAREISGSPHAWGPGACNALEALLAAALLHWRTGLQAPWYGGRQLLRVLLAALGVPVLTAALGASFLQAGGRASFGATWATWYLASALGLLILTPLLLSWGDRQLRSRALDVANGLGALGMGLGVAASVVLIVRDSGQPLLLLTFPLVLAMTWRYGLLGATTAVAGLAAAGLWATLREASALTQMVSPGAPVQERVQALQLYLAAMVLCSLPFAVLRAREQQLSEELRRRSDARAEFLAAMSHEIRTPLTGVLGMADLLAAQELAPEQRQYVESMRASGRHLLAVINDVLDFSRIESGKLTLERIDFALPELLEQVRSLVHPMALERGLAFDVDLAPHSPPVVRGDPTRLKQVLLNLVANALKFTPKGSVSLKVDGAGGEAAPDWVRFEVRDTGIGIAPEKIGQLFAAFSQADRSTVREYGGSGLGLAISKRLVDAMGGRIEVRSVEGEGSVFTVHVPLEPGEAVAPSTVSPAALDAVAPQRILVAEDVAVNRELLRAALGGRGHHVEFAHNGAEALERVRQQPFDMVLMDVQMPVMDGVEATRRIRALGGEYARLPIVALTANVMAPEQARYLEAGMDECLMKPIEWPRLAAAIARYGSGPVRAPAPAPARPAAPAESGAPAESEAPATPPRDDEPVALLDRAQFDAVRQIASPDDFALLIHTGIHSAQEALDQILDAKDPAVIAAAAHRVAGSTGTLGLARVSALAARLEEVAKEGGADGQLKVELAEALLQTRAALAAAGVLQR